ncbi:GIY-YIG nuclease family protein [Streptomyces abyssomicinicus]|uniref:GIY-YIG nuclease family protein n=1 Tax=Streptomyces abyssomicinicus TaxID=574929 RepID=UPI0013E09B77|nr:GIY-YIG nuclease family protein [Streptomyces abyssomicinicus]
MYLIGPPNTCIAKIGVSNDPQERLADLQVGSHQPLVLLWKTPGGQGLESALHAYFAPYRTHGEWFDFGEESPAALVATAAVLMGFKAQPDRIPQSARYRFDSCTVCAGARIRELPEPIPDLRLPRPRPEPRPKRGAPAALPREVNETTVATRVAEAVRRSEGPVRQIAIADVTGINKGSVSRAVQRLVADGVLVRLEDGRIAAKG